MAIGDPLNFDKTVTVGVVSAKDRSGLTADPGTRSFESDIQTDAAINFGNSGGPLLNVNGEVVGINTAIFRPAQNIGFAIPINTLKTILPQLREKGKVVRGFLGINIQNVDADRAAAFDLKGQDGAFVESVEAGKPAEKAASGRRHDRPGRQRPGQGHARPDRLRLRQGAGQQGPARNRARRQGDQRHRHARRAAGRRGRRRGTRRSSPRTNSREDRHQRPGAHAADAADAAHPDRKSRVSSSSGSRRSRRRPTP